LNGKGRGESKGGDGRLGSEGRLTVLMPLKNYQVDYLYGSVGCIVEQTCPHWLLLIIVEKADLDKFERQLRRTLLDNRVEIIVNKGRKLAGAINTGMLRAQTEFVGLLLADDLWSYDAVDVLLGYIRRNPKVDFFHSSRIIIDGDGTPISGTYYSKENFDIEDFKEGSPVKHLLCWRRNKALQHGGLDESLNSVGPDDYDLPWTMAENGATFKAITECLYYYRDHREGYRLTTHLPLSIHKREIRRIMRKHKVDPATIKRQIMKAEKLYLRQCLFRSRLHKWIMERIGYDARQGWRDQYR